MAEFSLQALHDEIEADPEALGYKEAGGEWKDDSVIADLINAKDYAIDQDGVEMESVRAATPYDPYNSLLGDEQEWLKWMTPNSGTFQVTADMKKQLAGRALAVNGVPGSVDASTFWASGDRTEMESIMLALIETPGSRAEVLWGAGQTVSMNNVGGAENL